MLLLTSLFLATLLIGINGGAGGQPRMRLRDTILIGKRLQPSNLEFFGGPIVLSFSHSLTLCFNHPFLTLALSGIPFAEPPIRFSPPKLKRSLSPLRSFDARNYGIACLQPVSLRRRSLISLRTHPPVRSNGKRRLRRTVSHSTYSDPPVLTSTRLCPSWSGFMGVDS